jgi:ATP-dependent RNA helicase DeaD
MTFQDAHPALARAIAARNYSDPTPVQRAVIEPDALGKDLLVSAQTGSGKTVAFGLAIASTLLKDAPRFDSVHSPLALIIAPTRELALQVQRELAWLYHETQARIVTCVGGMDPRAEARQLAHGATIVVGTPGRLRDHLERGRLVLGDLRAVVLDEADEMLDLGFREDLEFILDATPAGRQTLLFSATLPRAIEALATRYQRDARRIETIRRNEAHADISYEAIRTTPHGIEQAVVNVLRLHEARAALIFCATRESVRRMHAGLVDRGFAAVALSGELTQTERMHALQAVRDGRARVLVATDVAARGLDLPDLGLVIHAELPNDRETLLHRSGRTGRAGRKGQSVLIVPFNRRRKAEALIGAARITVSWVAAPTPEAIRARDAERFLENDIFSDPSSDEEAEQVAALQAQKTAGAIALALIRLHRAGLPAPEDVPEDRGAMDKGGRRERLRAGRDERDRQRADHKRPRGENGPPMVWFRLNIGRERNADPRWLLPLICRAGNITKREIGAIKIHDRDTRFEVAAEHAAAFAEAVKANPKKEGHISRIGEHAADPAPIEPRRDSEATGTAPTRHDRSGARHEPPRQHRAEEARGEKKPHRKGQRFSGKTGEAWRERKTTSPVPDERTRRHATPRGPSKYAHKKKRREDQRTS